MRAINSEIPAGAIFLGDDDLLQARRAAVLNSRQSKRPSAADSWVGATMAAVRRLVRQRFLILSSVGMTTWELVTYLASEYGGRQIIVIPISRSETAEEFSQRMRREFRLHPGRVGFLLVAPDAGAARSRKAGWRQRDKMIVELADMLLPISIRSGGNLQRLIDEAAATGKAVAATHQVVYQPGADRLAYSLRPQDLDRELCTGSWHYLTHWTRSSHAPYPGESSYDYYRDMVTSSSYSHAAINTLARIVRERRIRASRRFIHGGHRAVSFTSLHPQQAIKLMRWRRRYVYYNFEPYGIALDVDQAHRLGIRPVIYGAQGLYSDLSVSDKPFFQNEGGAAADWRSEAEYRHLGDLDLSGLAPECVRLIVYLSSDVDMLPACCPFKVLSLTHR